MKNTSTVLLVIMAVAIFVGIALATSVNRRQSAALAPSAPSTASVPAAPEASVDLSTIKNFAPALAYLGDMADSQRYYKIDWTHISEVDVAGQKMYFGMLEKTSGDGTTDPDPTPLFLANGVLYVAWGYGGNLYPLKETNWVRRYSDLSLSGFVPIDLYQGADQERALISKADSGIDSVSMKLDRSGALTHLEFAMGDTIEKFDAPLVAVKPVNLVTKPALAGAPDYNGYAEQWRKLAGDASGTADYAADTGYDISYPATLNGDKVIPTSDNKYNYAFAVSDDPSSPDRASMWCVPNAQEQVGPQKGEPVVISPESRSKIVDWGFRKEYQGETYSFTGPGFYCQITTFGAFRPDMFAIKF